jgi:D-lactate dehydrogenase
MIWYNEDMKIVFFEVMPHEHDMITAQLPSGHEVVFSEERLNEKTVGLAAGAQVVSVFVRSYLPATVLDQLPDLKLIATRSMGFDHIDVEHARSKGIAVSNVQTYASHPVAEFTFALILSVIRKIYPGYNHLREGTDFDQHGLSGFNLFGKTLGIVGTGRIGKNVATIAKGFGMKIIAFDVFPDEKFATEVGLTYLPLNDVVSQADIITIHTPYSKETHHLIDADTFSRMKIGIVFINDARGEIVDTHALVAALKDGTVWGAGLDVLEDERELREEADNIATQKPGVNYELLTANHILIDMPNVVITPHIAFETTEALQEIDRVTAEAISNFIAGKDQKYV